MKNNTEISFSFWLILFYSIALLALTHGQNDGRIEERINPMWAGHPDGFLQVNPGCAGHPDGFLQVNPVWAGHPDGFLQVKHTLALRGLEEPAHASRGLEEPFFQLCCCVSFWFWREIGFGCTYYYVLGVPYSCGVVLVFLVLAGNRFWCYVRT